MKILIVSDREFKETSRGIDLITSIVAEKGHQVDHLVFFKRKRFPEKQVRSNIRQIYFYDSLKLYRSKLQFLFPGFILYAYFQYIIKKASFDFNGYNFVVLESGHPIYLASVIKSNIIYRQSDPTFISFKSNRKFYCKLELEVIKKSLFVSSALKPEFYPQEYSNKFFYCHSGFIPCKLTENPIIQKSFCVISGGLDKILLKKIAGRYPNYTFNVIAIPEKTSTKKNLSVKGYLDFDEYQRTILTSLAVIIPYTDRFSYQQRQTFFTARLLLSIQLGKPILLRAFGTIQNSDPEKKLFVYKTRKEALILFDEIVKKIESGELNNEVSEETLSFLLPQTVENRRKELEETFSRFL